MYKNERKIPMKKISVKASKPYEVLIEQGILSRCGKLVSEVTKTRFAALVTDDGTLTLPNQYNQFKPHNCGFFCVKFSEFFRCMVLYFYFKYGII